VAVGRAVPNQELLAVSLEITLRRFLLPQLVVAQVAITTMLLELAEVLAGVVVADLQEASAHLEQLEEQTLLVKVIQEDTVLSTVVAVAVAQALRANRPTKAGHVMTAVVMVVQAYQVLLLVLLLPMLVAGAAVNEI
jgi:hypothetical protein